MLTLPPLLPLSSLKVRDLAAKDAAKRNKARGLADGDDRPADAPSRWSDYSVEFHFPEPTELAPPLIQCIDCDFKCVRAPAARSRLCGPAFMCCVLHACARVPLDAAALVPAWRRACLLRLGVKESRRAAALLLTC